MKLPELCIRKPVLATVISLVLIVLGLIAFQRLEVRFFPKMQLPLVTIKTYYEGASAKLMESQVTTILENALADIDNIKYIDSSSTTSHSRISIQFRLGGNLQAEAAKVRDKVASVRDKLPSAAHPPTVTVGVSGNPLMGIGFIDPNKTSGEIRNFVDRVVVPQLRQLPGVGSISSQGASDYAMRIWLNAERMAALGITVTEVKNAITSNNIYFPAGSIRGPTRNYSLVSKTQLTNANDFNNIIVKQGENKAIRLQDIATTNLGYTSLYDYPLRINGKNGVLLIIEPLQSANPIQVAKEIHQSLHHIAAQLPPGMQLQVTFDMSHFLQSSIHETFVAIGQAILLVILVVFLFLGSWRATSIPIITIPVSLIAVFFIIKLLGFTINTMSLLGMVLAIGLVVDDAIVMLENIHRHIEEGFSPFEAALKGSKEIAGAVVAMSITLIAVYAPIGFIQGFSAKLFQEFAFTLAAAVLISGFVALTLSPMMCSKILMPAGHNNKLMQVVDRIFLKLSRHYESVLRSALNHRILIIVALLLVAAIGYLIFSSIPAEFMPKEDFAVMNIKIDSPAGSTLAYTDKYTKRIEKILQQIPQIQGFTTQVASDWTLIRATMKPWGKRKLSTQAVIKKLNPILQQIPGVTAVAFVPDVVNYGEQGNDISLNFVTTGDYSDLISPMNKMVAILKKYPGLDNVRSNVKFDDQQYAITINRDLAATLGVNIQDIADTVSAMMSGNHWTDVQAGNKSYEVLVQMRRQDLRNFNAIKQLYVPATPPAVDTATTVAGMVPLNNLIKLTPTIGQGTLRHFNRLRSGTLTASVSPGYTESQAIQYIDTKLPNVLSSNVTAAYSGKALQFIQSAGGMASIMLLAFVFIYLVLSAQFGSFIDPLIILIAVPLSMVGALFFLWIGAGTFNLFSQIGLVTLVGMVAKHGILITQFINELRAEGETFNQAIVAGAKIRLRPILMTTAAMIFGSLPLALAFGPGSVGRHQIGWVIVGGLLFGTFFSLIVVPVAYSYLGKFKTIKTIDRQVKV